jgi:hypothetical protein
VTRHKQYRAASSGALKALSAWWLRGIDIAACIREWRICMRRRIGAAAALRVCAFFGAVNGICGGVTCWRRGVGRKRAAL